MKSVLTKSSLVFMSFLLVVFFSACKDKEDEGDECEKTKWNEAIHYNVMPKIRVLGDNIPDLDLKDAKLISYNGYVKKFYCPNEPSTLFNYSAREFYPEFIEDEYWTGGFLIGEAYGFFFNNDEDYLRVFLELTAVFDSFTDYTAIILIEVKPSEIYKDIDNLKEYFYIDLTADLDWRQG